VHRDLKPENILLSSKNPVDLNIKIADFGFATRIPDDKYETLQCGSPFYMAPEIVDGKRYRFEVDIWSIGVIAYYLLCGQPPFDGRTKNQLSNAIKSAEIKFNGAIWD
jgi:serine/threonine protein kinase